MSSLQSLLTAAVLFSQTSAIPLMTGFAIHQAIKNSNVLTSGPHSVMNTYTKFGAQPPPDVEQAALATTGAVSANPSEYDSEYLSVIMVGTPYQSYTVDIDTGSAVFSLYAPALGTSGTTLTTTVDIGGTAVTGQAVNLVGKMTDDDGIIGLAFPSANSVKAMKTFYLNAVAQGLPALFTANLKKGKPGNYNFGYINSSEYTGSITYATVSSANGFWEFTGSGYAIGSGAFILSSIDTIADTGTTLLYLPQTVVTAYYNKVSGAVYNSAQGGYTFPCSATLPSITLGIGSYKAVVPGNYVNYAPVSSTVCFGGIQANTGIGFSIYGLVFLKSQFVVFKGTTSPSIGFAAKPV